MNQTTLKTSTTLSGKGLHSGKTVTVTIVPAPADSGIVVRRVDLKPVAEIKVCAHNVSSTARGTTLSEGKATISTVEHLLSALHALDVDNVVIETDGVEIPILNGGSMPWVEAIQQAGIIELEAQRRYFSVDKQFELKVGDSYFRAEPSDHFSVHTVVDYHSKALGRQEYVLDGFSDYISEVAPCRTFCFLHEISTLLALGLIKGGSLDNALVFVDKPIGPIVKRRLAKQYGVSLSEVKENNGVLNMHQPLFDNEPARHKTLDFVGDIRLVGLPVKGGFYIEYPGHKANTIFAQKLLEEMKRS